MHELKERYSALPFASATSAVEGEIEVFNRRGAPSSHRNRSRDSSPRRDDEREAEWWRELERRIVVYRIGHNRRLHRQIRGSHRHIRRRLQPIDEKSINTGGFVEVRWRDEVSSTRRREKPCVCQKRAKEVCPIANTCPQDAVLLPLI